MDAIIELDHDFNIMMMNPAGEHIFGCQGDQCLGTSLMQFVEVKDVDRLNQIVRKLHVRPRGERSVWVPEGLIVLNTDGKKIPAEATISQIEMGGHPCYVLILRNVPRGYKEIRMVVNIDADAPPEKLKEIVELGPTYSPDFDTITRPVPVSVQLEK